MSNSFDSLFRIIKDPKRKKPLFPNKLDKNILVEPKKRNYFFQKLSHYSKRKKINETIALILSIISYVLYYLSLGGCDGTQTECLKNSNIAYYYLLVNYCFISAGIISLLLYLMILREVSKYHLIHIFIVFAFLFLSDTGASLMNHGTYNIFGFLIFLLFFCIFLGIVLSVQDLLMNKTLFKKLLVINTVILLVILSRYFIHNKLTKECKDWDLGLNNTRIEDDINKYACQIHRPISCHINYFNNKQDLSKLLKLQCSNNINSNQVINSRNLLIKYINRRELDKTKSFGFPLTNTPKFRVDNLLNPETFTRKVYDNIIDMDNPPKDLKPEEYPEITLNFNEISDKYIEGDKSMKYMGKININITRNEKIAKRRKSKENPNSLFNNIIMIYTDSVSRAHFKRKMPKTCSFIEKFMKNNFENDFNDIINKEINAQNTLIIRNKVNVNETKIRNLGAKKSNRRHSRKLRRRKQRIINAILKKNKKSFQKINENRKANNITLNDKLIKKSPPFPKQYKNDKLKNQNNTLYKSQIEIIKNKRLKKQNQKGSSKKLNEIKKNKNYKFNESSSKFINNYQNLSYILTKNMTNKYKNITNKFIKNLSNINKKFIDKLTKNAINNTNNTSFNFIYNSTYLNNSTRSINNIRNNITNISINNYSNIPYSNRQNVINKNNKRNTNSNNNRNNFNISDKYYAYQFLKYHTFTSGTKFNAMPMFFGRSVYDIEGVNIIRFFKELGYVTAQSLDMCSKEVWEPEKEPRHLDFDSWDHENVAMFCDPSYMDRKSLYSIYKGVYSLLRRCFYGKEVHDYIFEYGTKFWEAYPNNKKFLRLGFNDGHESTFEVMQYLDEPLYNFLNYFYNKGYLKNTALIVVSDHGNHMPGLYNLFFSDQYETERLLGNLYIIVNSDILFNKRIKEFKQFNENIMENQQSLITPYDIYNTLIHIIYGDINDFKYNQKGASLFMKIDNTKRDCTHFDQDNEEKGLCRCTPNSKYEKFIYYKNKN